MCNVVTPDNKRMMIERLHEVINALAKNLGTRRRRTQPTRTTPPTVMGNLGKTRGRTQPTRAAAPRTGGTSRRIQRPATSGQPAAARKSTEPVAVVHANIGRIIERKLRAPLTPTTAVIGRRLIHDCEIVRPNVIQRNFGIRFISQ